MRICKFSNLQKYLKIRAMDQLSEKVFKQNEQFLNRDELASKSIPDLSEHFYKSRNSLLLFSGLLIAWELIGISLEEASTSGLKVNIKNVDAIPYVILLLVIYFSYRLIVEWFQSDEGRRSLKQSRIDFYISLAIPVLAILLFFIQKIFGVSVFEKFQFYILFPIAIIFAFVAYAMMGWGFTSLLDYWAKKRVQKVYMYLKNKYKNEFNEISKKMKEKKINPFERNSELREILINNTIFKSRSRRQKRILFGRFIEDITSVLSGVEYTEFCKQFPSPVIKSIKEWRKQNPL